MKSLPASALLAIALCVTALSLGYITFKSSDVSSPLTIAPQSQTAQVSGSLDQGLISYWKFDEGSGSSVSSSVGGASDTLGTPSWIAGKIGSALNFTGADFVNAGNVSVPNITISAWIKPTGNPAYGSVAIKQYTYGIETQGNTVYAGIGNGSAWSPTGYLQAPLSPNVWQLVTQTFDGSTNRLYVNGSLVASGAASLSLSSSQSLLIGTWDTSFAEPFMGGIDDVRIYNRALSASEVASLAAYNGTVVPPTTTTGPVISNLAVSNVKTNEVTLTWTTDKASDTFVEFGLTSAYGATSALKDTGAGMVTTHTQTLVGLQTNTVYNYRVTSKDSAGNVTRSANSTFTTANVPDTTKPSVPTGLSYSSVTPATVTISWGASTDNVGVTGYKVFRNSIEVATVGVTSYTDTTLAPSSVYSYTIAAVDQAGNMSAQSSAVSIKTLPPAATATLSASATSIVSGQSTTLTWSSTNASSCTGVGGTFAGTKATAGTQTVSPTANTSYSITCTGPGGTSAPSSVIIGVTPAPVTAAPVISNLAVSNIKNTQARITWDTDKPSDTFVEFGLTSSYGSTSALKDTGANMVTSHAQTLVGLQAGKTYNYRVTSKDSAGRTTRSGNSTFTTTGGTTPTSYSVTVTKSGTGTGTVTSTGSINCGTTCTANGTPGQTVTLTATPATGSTFTGWTGSCTGTSTTCSFTLNANATVGAAFTLNTTNPSDTTAPSIPSGLTATAVSSSQINLTWNASTDNTAVTGYKVYRGGVQIANITPAATTFQNTSGLTAATAYSYTVSAYDAAGNSSAQSAAASATTLSVTPTSYSVTVTKSGTGTGTVTSTGSINCGTTCTANGTPGQTVTLTATPATGSTFTGWTGVTGCSTAAVCTFTLNANTTITATFNTTVVVTGNTYYITPGGAGAKNGADWNNAFAGIPATLVRGATYYFADGSYGGYDFKTPVDGTKTITFLKAVGQAGSVGHGTDTGYVYSTMGAGQATISAIDLNASYFVIDGQKGDGFSVAPADNVGSHYGFVFTASNAINAGTSAPGNLTDITIRRVYAAVDTTNPAAAGGGWFFQMVNANKGYSVSNLTISKSYFYGWGQALNINWDATWNNITWEYNVYEQMYTSPTYHGNPINVLWAPVNNLVVRYSLFSGTYGQGGLSEVVSANGNAIRNSKIYGNVFEQGWSGRAVIAGNCVTASGGVFNSFIYNNTFLMSGYGKANDGGGVAGDECSSGNIFQNNLVYYTNADIRGGMSHDYNHFVFTTNTPSEAHGSVVTSNIDPFVNYAGKNYRLKAGTPAGNALSAEYAVDALGNPRTNWTRGAFEYTGTVTTPTSYSVTVTKSGTGTGTVTSAGSINCGTTCTSTGDAGQTVTLTATPATGSTFTGWTGSCTGTSTTCSFTLNANATVGAGFNTTTAPSGTSFYMTPSGAGTTDGTSWANAFAGTSDINWASVKAGTTLYVGAGSYGTLTIGSSGSSATSRVTIKAAQDTNIGTATFSGVDYGGNDYVTIDGRYGSNRNFTTTGQVIAVNAHDPYFQGFNVTNTTMNFTYVGAGDISYNRIDTSGVTNIDAALNMVASTNSQAYGQTKIHDNTLIVRGQLNNGAGPDGIQVAHGSDIYNNTFQSVYNGSFTSTQHQDMLQNYGDQWVRVYNNDFIDSGDSMIDFSDSGTASKSHLQVYNNTFRRTIDTMGTVAVRVYSDTPLTKYDDIRIENNTFVDLARTMPDFGAAIRLQGGSTAVATNSYIRNNIFYNNGRGWPTILVEGSGSGWVVSNNLVNAGSAGNTNISGLTNTNGQTGAPAFTSYTPYSLNNIYTIVGTSASTIDKGTAISTFSTDKAGTSRPQSVAWDIGAYEFTGTVTTPTSYSVTVTKSGTGTGTVTSAGSINCGTTCSSVGDPGMTVTLTATPATGSTFTGWTGVTGCSTAAVCTFTLNANTTITATFNTTVVTGNTFYIRQGATGNGSGSDWTNAFAAFPQTMNRGATYYVADGTYGAYNFDDTVSGSQLITVKKATGADHGTETGWSSTYGDGRAQLGALTFSTDYYVVDGQKGSGSLNLADRDYGFYVYSGGTIVSSDGSANYITIKRTEIEGTGKDAGTAADTAWPSNKGFFLSGTHTNWTMSQIYLHDTGNMSFQWASLSNSIVENSYIARNESTAGAHAEGIYGFGSNNIIRNNVWEDIEGTGVVMISGNNWKVYNNVMFWTTAYAGGGTGNGAVADWSDSSTASAAANNLIYSNTIINQKGYSSGFNFIHTGSTGNVASNNLRYLASSGSNTTGTNNVVATTDPFVNWQGRDFRLVSGSPAINAGATLTSEYAVDLLGTTRPQSSAFDAGAYEFTGTVTQPSDTTAPSIPSGLTATAVSSSQINLTWNASTDNTAVTGYKVYRGGVQIGTATTNSYSSTGLTAATAYSYTVSAYDAAGNSSAQSAAASATTQAVTTAGCTQTLSVGANIVSAVSAAANGSTICLNSGDYGAVSFSGITRTGYVTVKSASGISAQMRPTVSNSDYIRLESMTLSSAAINNCSTNIQVVGNTWVQGTSGINVYDYGYSCDASNKNILIDGNKFVNVVPSWSEGKIGIVQVNGVTITNNLIQGQVSANGGDGIQTGGSNDNIVIGPGNIFRDIRQAACDATAGVPHCDAIQIVGGAPNFTITGNWFDNVEVTLQHHDGTAPVKFTNNLITNSIQMWAYDTVANNTIIDHNTFYGQGSIFWGKNGSGVDSSTGQIVRNNILINSANPNFCSTCSASYNLGGTTGQAIGTNSIVGTPTFVGGTVPTTWAGWQLAAGSLGKGTASDGLDRGTTYFGSGTIVTPPTPTSYSVTVTKSGTGTGTVTSAGSINCGATCTSTGNPGMTVTLTATPAAGSTFTGWTGVTGCSTAAVCTFTLNANTVATAGFNSTVVTPVGTTLNRYWNLNEASGTSAADSSGNAGTATLVGSPAWTTGVAGNGLLLNGTSAYVNAGNVGSSAFSISAWVNMSASQSGWGSLVMKQNSFGLEVQNGTVYANVGNGSSWTNTVQAPLTAGTWKHVVQTYDGTTNRLYVDGTLVASGAGTLTNTASNLLIGSWNGSMEFFNGKIDEVRIYNGALTAAEVSSLYSAVTPPVVAPANSTKFAAGQQIQVSGTGTFLNIRSTPSTSGTSLGTAADGVIGTIVSSASNGVSAGGYYWWYVTLNSITGWVVENYLTAYTAPVTNPPVTTNCTTTCKYVTSNGTGDGSSWSSPLNWSTFTPVRGNTYYVAGGSYNARDFAIAPSGSTYITIKKATAADHGTDTGWVSTYGTTQASITGTVSFNTDYWVFDGSIRNESDWFDATSYGFKISGGNQQIYVGKNSSYIQIKNTLLEQPPTLETAAVRRYSLDLYSFGGYPRTQQGIVVARSYFKNGNVPIFAGRTTNEYISGMLVEYNAFDNTKSNDANHGEAMSCYYNGCGKDFVIRYNKFRGIAGTAVIAMTGADNFQFYGNVIWNSNLGDGLLGFSSPTNSNFTNAKIFNNTIVDKASGYDEGIAFQTGSNNLVYNNLWLNTPGTSHGPATTRAYNAYDGTVSYSGSANEANVQTNISSAIFNGYSSDDFTLKTNTAPGMNLNSVPGYVAEWAKDMNGKTRSTWSRGAYEY